MKNINKIFKLQNKAYLEKLSKILIDINEIWNSEFSEPYAYHNLTILTNEKREIRIAIDSYLPDCGRNKYSLKINDVTCVKFTKKEIKYIIKSCSICERNQMLYRKLEIKENK